MYYYVPLFSVLCCNAMFSYILINNALIICAFMTGWS